MHDLAFEDLVQGPVVLTFDGHVLEVFTERFGSTCRLVRGMLHVESTARIARVATWCRSGR